MNLKESSHVADGANLVIFFHPFFSDGGVERTNIYLAKGLISRGYRVEFLTTRSTEHYRREVECAGIHIIEIGAGKVMLSVGKVISYLKVSSKRNNKVYFISCQYYVNVVSMVIAMILRRRYRNIRFINSERNHFSELTIKGGLKNRLIIFLIRHLYQFADLVIANSEETASDLSEVISQKVCRVYNPTINERIDTLKNEKVSDDWFVSDTRPCVIAIGRLTMQKDFSTLIKAFRLVREHIDAKLVILGEGDLRKELEQQIIRLGLSGNVMLPGFVMNPYKFLALSDVFVLSSRYEGLPNALIEAVYLGIPCVATECKSGPKEILYEGEGGYLVPVGNEKKMAEAIISYLIDPANGKRKVAVAQRGIPRFHFENIRDDFERAINS